MTPISYARHRFPPDAIRHAVWLYLRFTLSYRDVEEFLLERDLDVSYETVRRWVLKFGLQLARNLRARRLLALAPRSASSKKAKARHLPLASTTTKASGTSSTVQGAGSRRRWRLARMSCLTLLTADGPAGGGGALLSAG
jgi:hypothetical protein